MGGGGGGGRERTTEGGREILDVILSIRVDNHRQNELFI